MLLWAKSDLPKQLVIEFYDCYQLNTENIIDMYNELFAMDPLGVYVDAPNKIMAYEACHIEMYASVPEIVVLFAKYSC